MIIDIINPLTGMLESCILEFQGELEGDLPGEVLGNLQIKEGGGVEMSIGLHVLEGSIIKLKNPYLVTSKSRTNSDGNTPGSAGSLIVESIVRHKIIFENRPKPKRIDKL